MSAKALVVPSIYHIVVFVGYLAIFGGDWSAFVCCDREIINKPPYEHIQTGFRSGGYDGQFYYLISHQPFQKQTSHMDVAAMRHIRIGYPIVCWLCTGGDPKLLLYAMPIINLLACLATCYILISLSIHYRRPAWWGVIAAFGLNSGMAMLRDLTDPLATLMLVGLLASRLRDQRIWIGAIWAMLAVFCREQNAAAVGVLILMELKHRRWLGAIALSISLIALAAWIVALGNIYGHSPFVAGNLSYPFQGIIWRIQKTMEKGSLLTSAIHAVGLSAIVALIIGGMLALIQDRRFVSSWLILGGLVLTVCGSDYIYGSVWSYHRVFTYLPLGLALWSLDTGRRWPLWVMLPGILWPILAVVQTAATK
jgi:hypothetical protein